LAFNFVTLGEWIWIHDPHAKSDALTLYVIFETHIFDALWSLGTADKDKASAHRAILAHQNKVREKKKALKRLLKTLTRS
jgi:hypothetical protein